MTAILSGILGLIVGSFLNVVVLRHGLKSLLGRSECMSCLRRLAWYENIPVVSWLALRGRCHSCGSRISMQYPLVELSTGILFALVGASFVLFDLRAAFELALSFAIVSVLVAIATYDFKHTIIPDQWAYLFAGLSLVAGMLIWSDAYSLALLLIAGPIAALPLFSLWLVSRGRWMGLGDAKLALGIGWLLGPVLGPVAVFFAFIIGAALIVGIIMPLSYIISALGKQGIIRFRGDGAQLTMKSEVPFGPFLIASCCLVWFAVLYHVPLPLPW
jgi:leader peptidase (prepilin peptidase)/N-methyltransferase